MSSKDETACDSADDSMEPENWIRGFDHVPLVLEFHVVVWWFPALEGGVVVRWSAKAPTEAPTRLARVVADMTGPPLS